MRISTQASCASGGKRGGRCMKGSHMLHLYVLWINISLRFLAIFISHFNFSAVLGLRITPGSVIFYSELFKLVFRDTY